GPRFGAVITTVVLAVVLLTGSAWLLAAQLAVFAVGALAGLRYAPYGLLYRYLVRPRLGPPASTEPAAPPRFSQGVGMVFAAAGGASRARTPWCCTAATTTGSPPTPTGTSSCTGTTRCCCSTAAGRSGNSTRAS